MRLRIARRVPEKDHIVEVHVEVLDSDLGIIEEIIEDQYI